MARKPRKSKPRTTNKATLDKNAQKSKDLSTTKVSEAIPSPQLDDSPESLPEDMQIAADVAAVDVVEHKPEDVPTQRTKPTITVVHSCPDERCDFKTTSDEKNCPYDDNELVFDEKLNH